VTETRPAPEPSAPAPEPSTAVAKPPADVQRPAECTRARDSSLDALLERLEGVPAQTAVIVEHAELYHALDSIAGTLENRVRNRLGELLGSASAV
jgi:hypothetical protein